MRLNHATYEPLPLGARAALWKRAFCPGVCDVPDKRIARRISAQVVGSTDDDRRAPAGAACSDGQSTSSPSTAPGTTRSTQRQSELPRPRANSQSRSGTSVEYIRKVIVRLPCSPRGWTLQASCRAASSPAVSRASPRIVEIVDDGRRCILIRCQVGRTLAVESCNHSAQSLCGFS